VSSFTQSNCRGIIAKDEWPSMHPISIHWIIRFGGNAAVTAATETRNSSRV